MASDRCYTLICDEPEKVREDDLRRLGYGFMRCYWEDLRDLKRLERKLLRAGVPRLAP